MDEFDDVAIFWDYENCRPPSSIQGHKIANNIRDIALGFGVLTTFRAYLDLSEPIPAKSPNVRSEFQSSGVSLIDCPHNGRKDVADKMMIVDMMAHAMDKRPPGTIIVISGDRDFAYAVSVLRMRKYRLVVISPAANHESIQYAASVVLDWDCHVLGKTNGECRGSMSRESSTAQSDRTLSGAISPQNLRRTIHHERLKSDPSLLASWNCDIAGNFATDYSSGLKTHRYSRASDDATVRQRIDSTNTLPEPGVIGRTTPEKGFELECASSATHANAASQTTETSEISGKLDQNLLRDPPFLKSWDIDNCLQGEATTSHPSNTDTSRTSTQFGLEDGQTRADSPSDSRDSSIYWSTRSTRASSCSDMSSAWGGISAGGLDLGHSPIAVASSLDEGKTDGSCQVLHTTESSDSPSALVSPPADAPSEENDGIYDLDYNIEFGDLEGFCMQEEPPDLTRFRELVKVLVYFRSRGIQRPLLSAVGLEIQRLEIPDKTTVYARAGVKRLKDYAVLAQEVDIVELGGPLAGGEWVSLKASPVPTDFRVLVEALQNLRRESGLTRPRLSSVGAAIPERTAVYASLGFSKLTKYLESAEMVGIIKRGGPDSVLNYEWVSLEPGWYII